jgi:hypothetical protein
MKRSAWHLKQSGFCPQHMGAYFDRAAFKPPPRDAPFFHRYTPFYTPSYSLGEALLSQVLSQVLSQPSSGPNWGGCEESSLAGPFPTIFARMDINRTHECWWIVMHWSWDSLERLARNQRTWLRIVYLSHWFSCYRMDCFYKFHPPDLLTCASPLLEMRRIGSVRMAPSPESK